MRHIIFACLIFVLVVLVSACSPSSDLNSDNQVTASPESNSPSSVATTAPSNPPLADHSNQSSSEDAAVVLPDPLAERVRSFLAAETGIAVEAIALQQFEPVDWSDACIGVAKPEEFCAEVITPGYRVVLDTPNGKHVVHTDESGQTIRLAESP